MDSPNLKHLMRWRLRTLLLMMALLAAGLAGWNYLVVPYNKQSEARRTLQPLIGEVQSVPGVPWWLTAINPERFSRIVQVRGRSTEIDDQSIAPIADMRFIRRLYLNRTRIGDEGLKHIGRLRELERLSLWGSHISDAGLSSLRHCEHLSALDLHDTSVSDEGLKTLRDLSQLRELTLGRGVNGPGLKYVAEMPRLLRLDLSRTGIHYESLRSLSGSRIGWLHLPSPLPSKYCDVISSMPNLRVCEVQFVRATDRSAQLLSRCRLLESVDLIGVDLTDKATQTLVKMPRLSSLSLHGALTDDTLVALESAPQIKVVNLAGRFSQPALQRLAARRPDLKAAVGSVSANPYRQLSNNFLVRSLIHFDRGMGMGRVIVRWPATAADLKILPIDQRRSIQRVSLIDPLTIAAGYQSRFQREWTVAGLDVLPNTKSLQVPRLAKGELAKLGELAGLEDLRLIDDQLTDQEILSITLPESLKRLEMAPSRVSRDAVSQLRSQFQGVEIREHGHGGIYSRHRWQSPWVGQGSIDDMLRFKNLAEIQVQDVTSTLDITPLADLKRLRAMTFRGTILHAPVFELRRDMPQIQSLSLSMQGFNDLQMASLSRMPNLRRLLLRSTTITDRGLSVLRETPYLIELDVHAGMITGSGFAHLLACQELTSLKIQSASLRAMNLTHLKHIPNLTQLKLSYNKLGDDVCEHLAAMPSLERLELVRTAITDDGLADLGASRSLKTLFVGANQVTEAGLRAVASRCDSLRTIYVGDNPEITDEVKRAVHAEFPRVSVR